MNKTHTKYTINGLVATIHQSMDTNKYIYNYNYNYVYIVYIYIIREIL